MYLIYMHALYEVMVLRTPASKYFYYHKNVIHPSNFINEMKRKDQFCLDIRLTYRAGIGFSLYKKRINFRSSS